MEENCVYQENVANQSPVEVDEPETEEAENVDGPKGTRQGHQHQSIEEGRTENHSDSTNKRICFLANLASDQITLK